MLKSPLTYFLFVAIFMFSCSKGEDFTIKGRFVEDCDGLIPAANQEFHFVSEGTKGSFARAGLDKWVTTNANGEFQFTYNTKKLSGSPIYIDKIFYTEGYNSQFSLIKSRENVDLGNFIIGNNFSSKINLVVIEPYTSNDTLFLIGSDNTTIATVAGPFVSGEIGPFNFKQIGSLIIEDEEIYQNARAYFKSNINTSPSGNSSQFYGVKSIKICDGQQKVIDIEIR